MEPSILASTKAVCKVHSLETFFDEELLQHINAALDHLFQLGVGDGTFVVEDETAVWEDLPVTPGTLGLVKQFVFLKTRAMFDPPGTSYHLEASENQIRELEWRITNAPTE